MNMNGFVLCFIIVVIIFKVIFLSFVIEVYKIKVVCIFRYLQENNFRGRLELGFERFFFSLNLEDL